MLEILIFGLPLKVLIPCTLSLLLFLVCLFSGSDKGEDTEIVPSNDEIRIEFTRIPDDSETPQEPSSGQAAAPSLPGFLALLNPPQSPTETAAAYPESVYSCSAAAPPVSIEDASDFMSSGDPNPAPPDTPGRSPQTPQDDTGQNH